MLRQLLFCAGWCCHQKTGNSEVCQWSALAFGVMSFSLATRPDRMSLFLLLYIYFVGDYPVQCTLTLSQITSVNHTGSSMHVTFVTFVCGSVTLALCSNNHHSRPNSWRACILLRFPSFTPFCSNVLQFRLIHINFARNNMITLRF